MPIRVPKERRGETPWQLVDFHGSPNAPCEVIAQFRTAEMALGYYLMTTQGDWIGIRYAPTGWTITRCRNAVASTLEAALTVHPMPAAKRLAL